LPKLTQCVKLFEDKTEERAKEGYPPYYICGSVMNRVYLRGSRNGEKQTQAYEPFGWYCKRCGTFVTNEEYPKRWKEMKEVSRQINKKFFGH
jgi:hypothetical protein